MKRLLTGAACAALILPLAACGGGGGDDSSSTPPIALQGVSYDRFASSQEPTVNLTEGGDGPDVIYVDEGTMEFLGREGSTSGGTTQFIADDGSVALVTALPGFESTRLIRIEYAQTGTVTEGVIGRFTSEARMATARGSATYLGGPGSAEVRVARLVGESFDLTRGSTIVAVDFGTRRVDATLDFRGTPSATNPAAQVDLFRIEGMTIAGNRFSGGTLNSFKGTSATPDSRFSVSSSNLASSGVFAGWNDATGNVRASSLPAEVAGAFVADAGTNELTGRYLAD